MPGQGSETLELCQSSRYSVLNIDILKKRNLKQDLFSGTSFDHVRIGTVGDVHFFVRCIQNHAGQWNAPGLQSVKRQQSVVDGPQPGPAAHQRRESKFGDQIEHVEIFFNRNALAADSFDEQEVVLRFQSVKGFSDRFKINLRTF